ncbi:MAG: caspase family protein, partial [Bacteroidota bacterium]
LVHQVSEVSFVDETFRYYARQKENSSSPGWEVTDVLTLKPIGESGGYVYSIEPSGAKDYIVYFQDDDQLMAYSIGSKKLLDVRSQPNGILKVVSDQSQDGYVSASNSRNELHLNSYNKRFDLVNSVDIPIGGELVDHHFVNNSLQSYVHLINENEIHRRLIIDNKSGEVLFDISKKESVVGDFLEANGTDFSISDDNLFVFPTQPLLVVKESQNVGLFNYQTGEQHLITGPSFTYCRMNQIAADKEFLYFACAETFIAVDINSFAVATESIPYFLESNSSDEIVSIFKQRGSLDFSAIPNTYNVEHASDDIGLLAYDPNGFVWKLYDLASSNLKVEWQGRVKQTSATISDIFFGENQILNVIADDIWVQFDFSDTNQPLTFLPDRLKHESNPAIATNYFRSERYMARELISTEIDESSPDYSEITVTDTYLHSLSDQREQYLVKELSKTEIVFEPEFAEIVATDTYLYTISDQELADSSKVDSFDKGKEIPKNGESSSVSNDNITVHNKGDHLQIVNNQTGVSVKLYLFDKSFTTLNNLNGLYYPPARIGDVDYVVLSEEGLLDYKDTYSTGRLHFAKDLEIIEFRQLKDRYWVPGLLERVVSGAPLPVKTSRNIKDVDLYPKIDLTHPVENNGKLGIQLFDQGGGYGPVKILINGKEVSSDARDAYFDHAEDSVSLNIDITGHPFLQPGEVNSIEVSAYNAEAYIVSRPKKLYYIPEGNKADYEPTLHAIIVGTADYVGSDLDLSFPSKDAVSFSSTLELSAKNLLGTNSTNFTILTTDDKANWPSKENIKKAYESVAKAAKPYDAIVLYFAGHGTNYGGVEEDFYYLTADAANGNLKDPAIRESVAISSNELTEWIKSIPALKQVLIFDACHSGQFAEDLLAKRELRNASEVKSLERMKDRTGMYILSGSAADAVSYEASVYGQGLLTYALLFGMKGASLREDKFVDVVQLFQFAANKVPELAEEIGGIQKPEIRVPLGGESFDIGLLESKDRALIELPNPKPLYIRSSFQNQLTFDDDLELSEFLNEQLKNLQANGDPIVFVDVSKFSNAYSIRGQYKQKGDKIQLQANLLKDGQVLKTYNVKGSSKEQIIDRLIADGIRE